ncbi:MAG: sugar transferase [Bradymonadaceae bacterium]|nr:sugar transferase [Lujinxingiaceae bacterium]
MRTFSFDRLKRTIDLSAACVGLIAVSPVLVTAAAAIRLSLGSPVLYKQERPGLGGVPFTLWKFRTMRPSKAGEDDIGNDGPRLTALGQFLRSASIDELPTLFNVVRGEMSLVGPRPLLMRYLSRYTEEQARRHEVKPGITGWAQVNGRNNLSWEQKFALDVWYVDHRSLALDIKILAMTVLKVLGRADISQDGHVTAPEFMGLDLPGYSPDPAPRRAKRTVSAA